MDIRDLPKDKKIILFDGVCNLCNSIVQKIIRRDKKDRFRFAALQSDIGMAIVKHIGIDVSMVDSIILYEPGRAYYYKSDAALEIAKTLGGLSSVALILKPLPSKFRDAIYDIIARNRYKYFGKKEHCMVPSPEIMEKFL